MDYGPWLSMDYRRWLLNKCPCSTLKRCKYYQFERKANLACQNPSSDGIIAISIHQFRESIFINRRYRVSFARRMELSAVWWGVSHFSCLTKKPISTRIISNLHCSQNSADTLHAVRSAHLHDLSRRKPKQCCWARWKPSIWYSCNYCSHISHIQFASLARAKLSIISYASLVRWCERKSFILP